MDGSEVKLEKEVKIEIAKPTVWYDVDFNRVRDIGDIKNILQGMQLAFGEEYLENNPSLKPYVKLREEK